MSFLNRRDAGRQLATRLERFRHDEPVVLALPRGGVPVGDEIARALQAPLDIVVARKLGAPAHPEFAIGAIAPGVAMVDSDLLSQLGISPEEVTERIAMETQEMERRERKYRRGSPPFELEGRTVILVDDGLATGATARAALASIRKQGPARVIFAAPVCARDSAARLRKDADEVVCLRAPADFRAVSLHYQDFEPITDEEVLLSLDRTLATPAMAAF